VIVGARRRLYYLHTDAPSVIHWADELGGRMPWEVEEDGSVDSPGAGDGTTPR
jgi:hypothetical protein